MTDYADWQNNMIADIRANGRPTSGYFEGRPVLVLTTTGAKTGQPRTVIVSFSRDGDDYVVVGSKSGEPDDPAWFTNLVANPVVTVETDRKTVPGQGDRSGRGRPRRALGPARRGTPPVRRIPVEDRPNHPDRPTHAAGLTAVPAGPRPVRSRRSSRRGGPLPSPGCATRPIGGLRREPRRPPMSNPGWSGRTKRLGRQREAGSRQGR